MHYSSGAYYKVAVEIAVAVVADPVATFVAIVAILFDLIDPVTSAVLGR